MTRILIAALACCALAGCGTTMGNRAASGALIGGGAGLALGGIGAIPGAIVGGAIGAFTPAENINLGEPVWQDDEAETPAADPATAPAEPAPAAPAQTAPPT